MSLKQIVLEFWTARLDFWDSDFSEFGTVYVRICEFNIFGAQNRELWISRKYDWNFCLFV